MDLFTELLKTMGEKADPSTGRKAYVKGFAWIVLVRVKGCLYLCSRAGSHYPAPVELVKIEPEEFVEE